MLIFDMMESCHIIEENKADDAYGSATESYTVGESIQAAIIKNSTAEAIVAEKQDITETYTVVTDSGLMLGYHCIIRRDSDLACFIITSRGKDSEAPAMSTVQITKVTAERWSVPNGVTIN